jgi:hypothetical protein
MIILVKKDISNFNIINPLLRYRILALHIRKLDLEYRNLSP